MRQKLPFDNLQLRPKPPVLLYFSMTIACTQNAQRTARKIAPRLTGIIKRHKQSVPNPASAPMEPLELDPSKAVLATIGKNAKTIKRINKPPTPRPTKSAPS